MLDAPEVVADVGIEHVVTALGSELPQSFQRHRRTPLRPKPVRARQKIRLEYRLQHQLRRHLHHSVPYRRNAERPLPSIGLRYVPALHHLRPVLARAQLGAELFQEALHTVLLDVAE